MAWSGEQLALQTDCLLVWPPPLMWACGRWLSVYRVLGLTPRVGQRDGNKDQQSPPQEISPPHAAPWGAAPALSEVLWPVR